MFLLRLPENVGRELTSLFLAKEASFPRISLSCFLLQKISEENCHGVEY